MRLTVATVILSTAEGPLRTTRPNAVSMTGPRHVLDKLIRVRHDTAGDGKRHGPRVSTSEEADTAVNDADRQDVRASLEGDGDAYARIVRRHQGAIAAYVWRFSRDRRTCEELVQDVFVEAFLSLRSFRGTAPLSHWLRRIATRVGYGHWKRLRRQRLRVVVPIDEVADIARVEPERIDPSCAAATVHAMLARLAPRDRLVLTLMYLERCSVAEAAALTGWTKTMVKVQAYRARGKLKRLLEEQENSA